MTIRCETHVEFYDAIYELVKAGLGFNARTDELFIELTGTL
jgi:hypothetical protein